MYAISHAASALLLKKRYPEVPLWPLLVSVQAIELAWVALTYAGIERAAVNDHRIYLDFLPYSHSVGSTIAVALIAFAVLRHMTSRMDIAIAVALGVVSHVVLDIAQHQQDILLLPASVGPRLGLGLIDFPILNFAVEIAFGVLCWRIYRGGVALLAGIVLLNLANIPTMLQLPSVIDPVIANMWLLPTLILGQIVVTWIFVAWAARREAPAAA